MMDNLLQQELAATHVAFVGLTGISQVHTYGEEVTPVCEPEPAAEVSH